MPSAAATFHALASEALRARGELVGDPRRQVAKILAAHGDAALQPHRYAEYVEGRHDPASERIRLWLRAWAAAGYEPLELRVGPEGWGGGHGLTGGPGLKGP